MGVSGFRDFGYMACPRASAAVMRSLIPLMSLRWRSVSEFQRRPAAGGVGGQGCGVLALLGQHRFTPEYKDEAVKLVINTGRMVSAVARELGVQESTLGRWVHDFRAMAAAGEAGEGGLSEPVGVYRAR